ncbi:MAG: hypothetical protein EOM24_25145 [Chloroflexia bacterium]|nr:hypothetical protein [Chloroflexia bacterium]
MNRVGSLFNDCFSREALFDAYHHARRGKRAKRACFAFERRLGSNLAALHAELHAGLYRPQPYYTFHVKEPKPRLIYAPAFRDVVVQHAIYNVIYPIYDRTFIDTSFACRKGKGTHRCANYVQQAMRHYSGDRYSLHLDVRRFFYTIDRDILGELIARKVKDRGLLGLMELYGNHGEPLGIPIGNLLSQLYALIYLNGADHFAKRTLKVQHYARYVDDMVMIGLTLEQARDYREAMREYLAERLHLSLSKSAITPLRHGLNFVGYRTWRSRRFVRRHSLHRFGKALRAGCVASLNSLMGHAINTSTHRHYCARIRAERPDLIVSLPHYRAMPCT